MTNTDRDSKIKELQNDWLKAYVLSQEQVDQLILNKMERSKIYSEQVRKKIKQVSVS